MFVNYAPAAGLRGLWIGPYGVDEFSADTPTIGIMTLVMAIAMIVGVFCYGPMERLFGSRKWVVFWGNALGAAACFALFLLPVDASIWLATSLLALIGFGGSSFPVLMTI